MYYAELGYSKIRIAINYTKAAINELPSEKLESFVEVTASHFCGPIAGLMLVPFLFGAYQKRKNAEVLKDYESLRQKFNDENKLNANEEDFTELGYEELFGSAITEATANKQNTELKKAEVQTPKRRNSI